MSLYNMLHGVNPLAGLVLRVLGLDVSDIPRFRDAYYDGEHFIVLTRTGGPNRAAYEDGNRFMELVEGFLHTADWDRDNTYSLFTYSVPEKFSYLLESLGKYAETKTLDAKWDEVIASLQSGEKNPRVDRMVEQFTAIFKGLGQNLNDQQ